MIDKIIKRYMLPCVLSATLASTIVIPVNAKQNETYNPVRNLQFTSKINTNKSNLNTISGSAEQQTSGELKSETMYSTDNTSATLHMEYTDSGKTLELTEDSSEFYKDVFDKKLLVQNDSSKNVLDFTANSNGVYFFEVNVKDDKGTVIDTQQVRFKILDIVDAENEEVQQDENAVASASVQTNSIKN